jgi:hypothetical protein
MVMDGNDFPNQYLVAALPSLMVKGKNKSDLSNRLILPAYYFMRSYGCWKKGKATYRTSLISARLIK